jgi:hypothetical protein
MATQTTYGDPPLPSPGTIAGQNDNSRISSHINEDPTEITFGRAVCIGYLDNGVTQGGLLEDFVGCAVRDVTTQKDILSVLDSGDIWVEPNAAVAINDPVYFVATTGVWSNSPTGTVGPVPGARFKTSCESGGRAIVSLPTYLNQPAQAGYDPIAALGSDLIEYWDASRADTISEITDSTYTNAVDGWTGLILGSKLAMSTPNLKPTYVSDDPLLGPCINFDGVQQRLVCTDAPLLAALPSGANPCELWALCTQDIAGTDATTRHLVGYADTSVTNGRSLARVGVSNVNRARTYTGTGAAATTATDTVVDFTGVHVLRGIFGGAQTSLEIDSNAPTNVSVVPVTSVPTRLCVGSIPALAGSNFWKGKVAALFVTKPLSVEKAAALHAYLG